MFHSCEKSLSRKNPVLPFEKCPALVHPGNAIMLQHLIIQFLLYYLSSRRLRERLKTKVHFKLLALKVVGVAWRSKRGCRLQEVLNIVV